MKKITTYVVFTLLFYSISFSQQYFYDDFETYTVNTKLGPQSPDWTTWSGVEGGSEDADLVDTKAHSGTQSAYIESSGGGGPQDVVLDFGKVHSTGRFKFTSWFYVPKNKGAYFNFQGGASVAQIWTIEFYMLTSGNFNITSGGTVNGTFPQDQWFELVIDVDLDSDLWEVFIDGVSQGTFTNTNPISYIDLFPANSNTEFWVDDISFCTNNACNPEISMETVSISPTSLCTHEAADVTFKMKNNSTFPAKEMTLALEVGPKKLTQKIGLNNLAGGKDTTITLKSFFNSTVAGAGVPVSAINQQGDLVANNDTAKTTVDVKPSPSMAKLNKGAPFITPKPASAGTLQDPDIVAAKDIATYDIIPPAGFSNSDHGNTWEITGITLRTINGTVLSSSYFTFTPPSGSANGKITYEPDSFVTDTTLTLSFSVRNKANLCDTVLERYIHNAPKPSAGFSFTNVCDKQSMGFKNTSAVQSGIILSEWFFGDLTDSDLTDPSKLYNMPGKYNVKLVVTTDYGYKDSVTQQVEVYPIPSADFEFTNACEGKAVELRDKSTLPIGAPSFEWDFGTSPASGSTMKNATKLYNNSGIYNVTLTVEVNGCKSEKSKFVTQAPRLAPDFSFSTTQCDNLDVDFTNMTADPAFGSASYEWNFGDGAKSTAATIKHTYNTFSTFDVTLIGNTDLGCIDSITKTVTLKESPKAAFSYVGANCTNDDITFTNNTNVPSSTTNTYSWDFGDGNGSTSANPVSSYSSPGTYEVELMAESSNGCKSKTTDIIVVNEKPKSSFTANDVCLGEETKFVNGSVISTGTLTYTWDLDNGSPTTGATNPSVTYGAANTYNVSLIVESAVGCTDTTVQAVVVSDLPSVDINVASNQTQDGTMLFSTTSTGAGYTYFWTFGDGGNSDKQNPTYKYVFQGSWPVVLVVRNAAGCENSLRQVVNVYPLSVNEAKEQGISVYPNPATTTLTADLTQYSGAEVTSITLTDIVGKVIATTNAAQNGQVSFDVSNQPTGVYYLNINTENTVYAVKVLVTK